MIRLWTLPKIFKKPWSVRGKLKVLNSWLLNIKQPYKITRVMIALEEFGNRKASLFRGFFFFVVDVLEDVLPKEFFYHFVNLSYSMFVLLHFLGIC
jgi:hypothetical protein